MLPQLYMRRELLWRQKPAKLLPDASERISNPLGRDKRILLNRQMNYLYLPRSVYFINGGTLTIKCQYPRRPSISCFWKTAVLETDSQTPADCTTFLSSKAQQPPSTFCGVIYISWWNCWNACRLFRHYRNTDLGFTVKAVGLAQASANKNEHNASSTWTISLDSIGQV